MNDISSQKSQFDKLKKNVIDQNLCTHCGLCAGLSRGTIEMRDTLRGPIPHILPNKKAYVPQETIKSCPGLIIDYPKLNKFVFGNMPKSWLIGEYKKIYIGHSVNEKIRRAGASGGIITQVCIELLKTKKVDGVIASRMSESIPWKAETIVATSISEIISCSQSIYQPIPVLSILGKLENFSGNYVFVGLPDQIAAIRNLQRIGHPLAKKIIFCIGPYAGTNMYFESIRSFLRSNGVSDHTQIKNLKYRDGEWPGYLSIEMKDGRIFKAEKFYYNYLIPFFITKSSLTSIDLTNELADISVGDAWNPKYEKIGKGFSVVIGRSKIGQELIEKMQKENKISLSNISANEAIKMHAHMIEFKKRGAFIRLKIRKFLGSMNPQYGYANSSIPLSRFFVELVIFLIFAICGTRIVRKIMELIPVKIMGNIFNTLRVNWKRITRPAKRTGLMNFKFQVKKL